MKMSNWDSSSFIYESSKHKNEAYYSKLLTHYNMLHFANFIGKFLEW